MKLAVIGANGRSGKEIVNEAKAKGIDVFAIVRDKTKVKDLPVVEKDIMSLTQSDLAPFDVIISAIGIWDESQFDQFTTTTKHLCDLIANSDKRLLIVGGAGSLYVNPEQTLQAYQTSEFPKEYLPLATAMAKQLDYLRTRKDVNWTYVSPAAIFDAEGERTNKIIMAGEQAITNQNGKSYISYSDYAIGMIDEVLHPQHNQERISVIGA